jgi:hypothetical protein
MCWRRGGRGRGEEFKEFEEFKEREPGARIQEVLSRAEINGRFSVGSQKNN